MCVISWSITASSRPNGRKTLQRASPARRTHHGRNAVVDILARLSQARSCDGAQADGDVRRALQVVVAHAAGAAAIVLVQVLDAPPAPPQDWVDVQLQPLQQPPRRRDGVAVDATVAERVERHTPPAPAAWVLRAVAAGPGGPAT